MTTKNDRQQLEIEYRRQCVKDTWIKLGAFDVTQRQITEALKADYSIEVDRSTVSRDLAAIKKTMREQTPEELKAFLMAEYHFIIGEARAAWRKSLEDAQTTVQESTQDGTGKQSMKAQIRKEGQSGNAAFLSEIRQTTKSIREMFGVDAPTKQEHSGEVGVVGMTLEEWHKERNRRQNEIAETLAIFEGK